jgi:hypothetical protein
MPAGLMVATDGLLLAHTPPVTVLEYVVEKPVLSDVSPESVPAVTVGTIVSVTLSARLPQ